MRPRRGYISQTSWPSRISRADILVAIRPRRPGGVRPYAGIEFSFGVGLVMRHEVWLDPISHHLRARAVTCLDAGDVIGFLSSASNECGLDLVWNNQWQLQMRGIYEPTLLQAYTGTRTSSRTLSPAKLRTLFRIASPARLRAAGEPLPGRGPFTLYRGVAGVGRARSLRGLSWTASKEQAFWFALRYGLQHPAVFRVTAREEDVLAYDNSRQEQEFILELSPRHRLVRVELEEVA